MLPKSSFNEENLTNLCLIDCQVKIVERVYVLNPLTPIVAIRVLL